jgi:hypothetical protein
MAITMCGPNCTTENKNGGGRCADPQVTFSGAVLALYERNGYDDSDFYAVVWDASASDVRTICYGSTSYWSYHNGASVDASPDIDRTARAARRPTVRRLFLEQLVAEAKRPVRGCKVRALVTRGKNVGVEGTVTWVGVDHYRSRYGIEYKRFGISVEGNSERVFMSEDKVERIDITPVSQDDAFAQADAWVDAANWRSLINPLAPI